MQGSHKKFNTDIKRITKNWTSGTENSLPVPHILEVIGPKHCGKTTAVLTAITDCIYFSFRNFTEREALRVFCEQVAPEAVFSPELDWAAAFSSVKTKQECIIVLDDVTAACASESFFRGCKSFAIAAGRNCLIVISEKSVFSGSNIPTKILRLDYFCLADIEKLLKHLNYRDAFRVLTATSGIPELCNLFVGRNSFEEALSEIINLRSPIIRFVPEYMETLFRNPEMYHAILHAVAIGHTRNSQIAARIGEPNNKCDKYCQVLINHKILENHNHSYRFVNSYFELWYAVFYGSPRGLYREESKTELIEDVIKKVDEITTRRFLDAVHREIDVAKGEKSLRPSPNDIHFSNRNTYHFDQIIQGSTRCKFVKIFPPGCPAFGLHELDELCDAVSTITEPYNTDIFIHSWFPFSERIRRYEEDVYFLHLISAEELL